MNHPKKLIRQITAAVGLRKKKPRAVKTQAKRAGQPNQTAALPKKSKLAVHAAAPAAASALANPLQTLLQAASFAARKHHGQTRADNLTPYFSHVARVTLILTHVFEVQDEDILTAALLHDTLEDTATDYDEICEQFGARVADYVVALTKNVMLPKKEREEEYARRLTDAPEAVMIAKMADLYDNLSDRVGSPKLPKTAATAGRMLGLFGPRLKGRVALAAHAKLTALLAEVRTHLPVGNTSEAE